MSNRDDTTPATAAAQPVGVGDLAAPCQCRVESLPGGEGLVLHVVGEVDVSTEDVLRAGLRHGLLRHPGRLLVDLAELGFCSAHGLSQLIEAAAVCAGHGIGYALCGTSAQFERLTTMLWPPSELPVRYPSITAALEATRTPQPARPRVGHERDAVEHGGRSD